MPPTLGAASEVSKIVTRKEPGCSRRSNAALRTTRRSRCGSPRAARFFVAISAACEHCSEMQRITPGSGPAIGCSAAELRPPRVMRSFETSAHVRSHCSPRLYPSNALRDFRVCVTRDCRDPRPRRRRPRPPARALAPVEPALQRRDAQRQPGLRGRPSRVTLSFDHEIHEGLLSPGPGAWPDHHPAVRAPHHTISTTVLIGAAALPVQARSRSPTTTSCSSTSSPSSRVPRLRASASRSSSEPSPSIASTAP